MCLGRLKGRIKADFSRMAACVLQHFGGGFYRVGGRFVWPPPNIVVLYVYISSSLAAVINTPPIFVNCSRESAKIAVFSCFW